MRSSENIYTGIDIGSQNTRAVIGVLNEGDSQPTIIGAGIGASRGMRKGVVISVEEAATVVADVVEEAERMSGQHIEGATVGVNGAHVIGLDSKGVIAISNSSHEIEIDDLERVEEAATVVQLPPNREILQVFARNYSLDGQQNIKEPLGMSGVRLEVNAHLVTASTPAVKSLDRVLEIPAIEPHHHIVSVLAASEAVLGAKQRESGSVVIDIGASTTGIAIVEEDDVQHVAILPVGSDNITNDLAIGLKTEIEVAELVKIEHTNMRAAAKKSVKFEYAGNKFEFDPTEVSSIVQARLDELFELVNSELSRIGRAGKLPGGALLVGGGANLKGIDVSAKEHLQLPARVMHPKNKAVVADSINSPEMSAAVGLMLMDYQLGGTRGGSSKSKKGVASKRAGALAGYFTDLLGRFKT